MARKIPSDLKSAIATLLLSTGLLGAGFVIGKSGGWVVSFVKPEPLFNMTKAQAVLFGETRGTKLFLPWELPAGYFLEVPFTAPCKLHAVLKYKDGRTLEWSSPDFSARHRILIPYVWNSGMNLSTKEVTVQEAMNHVAPFLESVSLEVLEPGEEKPEVWNWDAKSQ